VDAVHFTPHAPVSARALGADFLGFSFYKVKNESMSSINLE
jgi:selenocysteine lyase/cysteine desulfurase